MAGQKKLEDPLHYYKCLQVNGESLKPPFLFADVTLINLVLNLSQ